MNHPLSAGWTNSFGIQGRVYDPEQGEMSTRLVSPGYLETVGAKLADGRFSVVIPEGRWQIIVLDDDSPTPPEFVNHAIHVRELTLLPGERHKLKVRIPGSTK